MLKSIVFSTLALCSAVSLSACDDAKKADDKKADAKKADDKKVDAKADDKKADDTKADGGDAQPADGGDVKPADGGDAQPADGGDAKPADGADALVIKATHEPSKPEDPVTVTLTGLKVTKAEFDPKDITGGTVEVEIDPTTLDSASEKRDGHLKSADYLDVEKHATIKVSVSDIAKVAGDTTGKEYTGKIVVDAHGQQVTWDATPFQVVETTDTAIKVHLTQEFERTAFGIGKAEGDPTATKLSADLTMTIAKTN